MKVLVMGGTRFNGLAVTLELARRGHDVTVFNRGKSEVTLPRSVKRVYGDRHDHAALKELFKDQTYDCIQDINAYTQDDVRSMVELFHGRVGHYVFASSTVIYARASLLPITEDSPVDLSPRQQEYGRNKVVCENYLLQQHRERGFPASIVCFSMVFGPNNFIADREQRMFKRMQLGRPVLIPGDGRTVGQVGHVQDEARALERMMGRPVTLGKRYNLTGKDVYTDEGYVDTFAAVMGVEPRKVFIPAQVMNELTAQEKAPLIQRVAPYIHGWNDPVFFSVDRLRRDIDWEPEYTFASAVQQTYEWFEAERIGERVQFDFAGEDALLARLKGAVEGARPN